MKSVLITGAGKGIGYECVKIFSKDNNSTVLALTRSKNDIKKLSKYNNVVHFIGDVSSKNDVDKFFYYAKNNRIKIDRLINKAGIRQRKDFLKIKSSEINEILSVNFLSIFYLMQVFSKNLIKKKNPGAIVNIGSIVGSLGFSQLSGYASSKMALIGLTKSFAVEMSKYNIRANIVNPGFTKTSFYKKFKSNKKLYNWTLQRIPMKRWGEPIEIANLIDFLLSEKSSYINGEVINIDGGWTNA
jgi:NAD(P)-dependent dehydrogenase (short-subunit alcohol dehydrogenase family)